MADKAINWADFTGSVVTRLRTPKPPAAPPKHFIQLAETSWKNGTDEDGKHYGEIRERHFTNEEGQQFGVSGEQLAADFAKNLKAAGAYMDPPRTVLAPVDPDHKGDKTLVRWQTVERRGRKL